MMSESLNRGMGEAGTEKKIMRQTFWPLENENVVGNIFNLFRNKTRLTIGGKGIINKTVTDNRLFLNSVGLTRYFMFSIKNN